MSDTSRNGKGSAKLTPEQEAALALSEKIKVKEKPKKAKAAPKAEKPAPKNGETRKGKGGRKPMAFSPEIADEICARVATGEALYRICQDPHMPSLTTIYKWLRENDEFAKNYTRAKDDMADTFTSKTQAIIDEPPQLTDEGKVDSGWVQWQRTRIDTLKWNAGKLKPKVYGDKIDLNHGGQPGNPIQTLFEQVAGTPVRPVGDGGQTE